MKGPIAHGHMHVKRNEANNIFRFGRGPTFKLRNIRIHHSFEPAPKQFRGPIIYICVCVFCALRW